MKFISINGSTCAGKTSLIKEVMKHRDHLFKLSYDTVKRSISDYSPEKHFGDVHTIMLAMEEALCKMQYDIISDSGLRQEWREKFLHVPRAYGYDIVEINLECDYDLLAKRFDERVARALANPDTLQPTNLSKDRFKELHDMFQTGKNPRALTFRTDEQSTEAIAESVLQLF
ncbi:MAG: AAA family ATPase [Candidatus Paceibacterota bacterium]|jgi:predicted kinase